MQTHLHSNGHLRRGIHVCKLVDVWNSGSMAGGLLTRPMPRPVPCPNPLLVLAMFATLTLLPATPSILRIVSTPVHLSGGKFKFKVACLVAVVVSDIGRLLASISLQLFTSLLACTCRNPC